MEIMKDRIVALRGSWGSGLATLIMEGNQVFCENGPTVRAMDACFGNVIGEGHTIDNEKGGHVGREIFYSLDEMGITLGGFTPVEEASDELLAAYEAQFKKKGRSKKGK
jgi:hypothetical protein